MCPRKQNKEQLEDSMGACRNGVSVTDHEHHLKDRGLPSNTLWSQAFFLSSFACFLFYHSSHHHQHTDRRPQYFIINSEGLENEDPFVVNIRQRNNADEGGASLLLRPVAGAELTDCGQSLLVDPHDFITYGRGRGSLRCRVRADVPWR